MVHKKVKKNRSFTDIPVAIVFIIVLALLVVISIVAYTNGDPMSILSPTDSKGNICGRDKNSGKPFSFVLDFRTCFGLGALRIMKFASGNFDCLSLRICTDSCPDSFSDVTTSNYKCSDDVTIATDGADLKKHITDGKCSSFLYPTISVFGRCIPDIKKINVTITQTLKDKNDANLDMLNLKNQLMDYAGLIRSNNLISEVVNDVGILKYWLLFYASIPMILSLLIITLFGIAPYPIIMTFSIVVILFTGSVSFFSGLFYYRPEIVKDHVTEIFPEFQGILNDQINQMSRGSLMIICILFGIFFLIALVCTVFLATGIQVACECLSLASSGIRMMIFNLFIPLFLWFLHISLIVWIGSVVVYLYSTNVKTFKFLSPDGTTIHAGGECQLGETGKNSICLFDGYGVKQLSIILILIVIFGFFWLYYFINALEIFQIAYSFSKYYFNKKKRSFCSFVTTSMKAIPIALSFNLGSLAFGSLLIALVMFLRLTVDLAIRFGGSNFQKLRKVVKVIEIILSVLQKLLERITGSAYIHVAITGKNFCSSTFKTLRVFGTQPVGAVTVSFSSSLLAFFGQVLVIAITGICVFEHIIYMFPKVLNPLMFSIVFSIISIPLAVFCFTIFRFGMLTIFYCICYDLEKNDGTIEKPYHMSKNLMRIFKVRNELTPAKS